MRLIDADALDEVVLDLNTNRGFGITRGEYKLIDSVLFEFPTIEERKKGEWIPQDHNRRTGNVTTTVYYYPKCSECGCSGNYGMNFCPNCGADMRGERDE